MKKTTKRAKDLVIGVILCLIGIVIGLAYIFKFFPFDYTTPVGESLLAVWAITGWLISAIFLLWGLCKLILDD